MKPELYQAKYLIDSFFYLVGEALGQAGLDAERMELIAASFSRCKREGQFVVGWPYCSADQ